MNKRTRLPEPDVILISDDEDEPAAKRKAESLGAKVIPLKSAPAAPSQEVLELKQKVAKLEKDFKGACRIARAEQLKVEALEKIIEVKPAGASEEQLLIADLRIKLAATSKQLFDEKRQAMDREDLLKERLEEMAMQLAECKGEQQQLLRDLSVNSAQQPRIEATPDKKVAQAEETGHPTNLFIMYAVDTSAFLSFDSALTLLRKMYKDEGGKEAFQKYYKSTGEQFECKACDTTIRDVYVITHFLSPSHITKVRDFASVCTSVSLDAQQHWAQQLQAACAAAEAATPAARAAAVSGALCAEVKAEEDKELVLLGRLSYEERQQMLYRGLGSTTDF